MKNEPTGFITTSKKLSATDITHLKKRWNELWRGGQDTGISFEVLPGCFFTPITALPNNAIQDELLPSEASQTELRKMNSAGQKIKNHSQSS